MRLHHDKPAFVASVPCDSSCSDCAAIHEGERRVEVARVVADYIGEEFDPSDYERPSLPPVLRPVAEQGTETTVHLAQLARGSTFVVWCGAPSDVVAFDPRVANCAKCLRALHEAVSQ
jgi:hypothetical protein